MAASSKKDNTGSTEEKARAGAAGESGESGTTRRGGLKEIAALFFGFLKLGLFTIGGGYAMIPQMQSVAVDEHHWLTEEEVIDCIAVSQSLPGIIAINMATYIGRKLYGFKGAVAATIGVVLPSFIILSLAVLVLDVIRDNPWVAGAFLGVKSAICGLILVSAIRLGKQVLRTPFQWILMIAAFAAIGIFGINAVWVILAAAILGIVYTSIRSGKEVR